MDEAPLQLSFEGGTLRVSGRPAEQLVALPGCRFDARSGTYRAEARAYRALVEYLRRQHIPYRDEARAYQPAAWPLRSSRDPFPHQTEALEAWRRQGGLGLVELPPG